MEASKRQNFVYGLVLAGLLMSGCQTGNAPKVGGLDNTGFMSLWETYSHCKTSTTVSEASRDMRVLTQATRLRNAQDEFVLPLPGRLQQLVSNPTNRLAVDVNAMASACSLHAGQLALEQGQIDVARELFSTVLTLQSEQEPSYYLAQAKSFLRDIDRGVEISSIKTP